MSVLSYEVSIRCITNRCLFRYTVALLKHLEYIYSNPQNYYENVQHVANALRVPTDEIFQRMRKTLERMTDGGKE